MSSWIKTITMKKYLSIESLLMMLVLLIFIIEAFVFNDPIGLIMAGFFPFAAVTHSDGTKNVAGTRITSYFCPISAITAEPSLAQEPTTIEEKIYMSGTYTCDENKNFVPVYLTYKTGTYKAEPAGEIDGEGYTLTAEFFHPGSKTEVAALAASVTNTPCVLIILEENGERLVLGSTYHPCYIKAPFDLGSAPSDRKGFTFKAEAYSGQQITRYNGAIPISGGEVSAIS